MYAVIRVNSLDPAKVVEAADDLRWLDELHTQQPGFLGSVVVDLADGRQVVVHLWESAQHSRGAASAIGPWVSCVLTPLSTAPSQLVGAGAARISGLRVSAR